MQIEGEATGRKGTMFLLFLSIFDIICEFKGS